MIPAPLVRRLGRVEYRACERAMERLGGDRPRGARDELWLLEHPAVLTLGVRGDRAHVRPGAALPVARSRRGGQATCHAPGQLVAYLLADLPRLGLGPRALVARLEDALLALAAEAGLPAQREAGRPGVYVRGRKLASIGLRVQGRRSSHGLALNVHPDLALFRQVVLCGRPELRATSLRECGIDWSVTETAARLLPRLLERLYRAPAPA